MIGLSETIKHVYQVTMYQIIARYRFGGPQSGPHNSECDLDEVYQHVN